MKNKNLIIFSAALVVLLAIGLLLGAGITSEQKNIRDKKAKEAETQLLLDLVSDTGATKVEEVKDGKFLTSGDTKIIKSYVAKKGDATVGMIYVGETKGWKEGLQVAFGINAKTHKIVGMNFLENNETPIYFEELKKTNFQDQFESKDLNEYLLTVNLMTGATPGGSTGTIAPATSAGVQKVMLLAREQYSKDTAFEMPVGIVFVSKTWDFTNKDQFIYKLSFLEEDIDVVVNRNHEIVSISDEAQRASAQAVINENKFVSYIESIATEGATTTLVIHAKTYSSTYATTTVTITNGVVVDVDLVYSAPQTYEDDHNGDYHDGPDAGKDFSNAESKLKDDVTIEVIAGATRTWEGLHDTQLIIRGYLEANK